MHEVQYDARSLFVDALSCVKCSTPIVVLAFLSDLPVTAKILRQEFTRYPHPQLLSTALLVS